MHDECRHTKMERYLHVKRSIHVKIYKTKQNKKNQQHHTNEKQLILLFKLK